MSFSFFVARRFFQNISPDKPRSSNPSITIATAGVAIGLAVMIITISVIAGFKSEISKKIEGFGSHIEVLDLGTLTAPDGFPIRTDSTFIAAVSHLPNVAHTDRVVQKMGIIKTNTDFKGITFKGLPATYDTTFIASCLVEGRLPRWQDTDSNDILISRLQADELGLKVGDRVFSYFFEESIKTRRFTICGIYCSNMNIFDNNYVLTPISTIERLNHWDNTQASVLEVRLHDIDQIPQTLPALRRLCEQMNTAPDTKSRQSLSIKEHYAQVFAWLNLLDVNMVVILCLMVAVSGFTMVSGLFILILERTQTIGVLKALGAGNTRIRAIFLHFAALITLRGLLIGDVLALALLMAEKHWGFIHLDASTYYVDTVPILLDPIAIVAVNVGTLVITILALVAPSYMISRIQPAKAIRFE